MSILIKDMEMPTERESFNLTIKYNGTVFDTETGIKVAEAYELPPHGDLIERKAICLTNFEIAMCGGDYKEGMKMLLGKTESAPTIIPADGEKNE